MIILKVTVSLRNYMSYFIKLCNNELFFVCPGSEFPGTQDPPNKITYKLLTNLLQQDFLGVGPS